MNSQELLERILSNKIHGDELIDARSMLKRDEITSEDYINVLETFQEQQVEYASDLETKNIIEIMNLKKDVAILKAKNDQLEHDKKTLQTYVNFSQGNYYDIQS